MSYEFVVSIYFVQAMDNVSSLKWLREYSHRLARVLSHGIVSLTFASDYSNDLNLRYRSNRK